MQKILELFHFPLSNNTLLMRRAILMHLALLLAMLFFLIFAIFNTTLLHRPSIAMLNALAFILSCGLFVYLLKTKNLKSTAYLTTVALIGYFLTFIINGESQHYSLIWTIFVPIFAIYANGKRIGLYFSLLFYALLFTLSYYAIGEWDHGNWTIVDWSRLVGASLLLLFSVYINENTYETYDAQIQQMLAQEKELAITDQLTQLYNRRYYDTIIEHLIATAKRNHHAITFFILDIDFFKKYNDYYGHSKGDDVLLRVAQTLKAYIQRENDFVFRLGGEEFGAVLIAEHHKELKVWIQGLNKAIEDLHILHEASDVSPYLTVSIGVVTLHPDTTATTAKDLYLRADQALYRAKAQGRNCSVFL